MWFRALVCAVAVATSTRCVNAQYFPDLAYSQPQAVGPGTTVRMAYSEDPKWQIQIIEVDMSNSAAGLIPLYRPGRLERISTMARRAGAIAAVNAGYFDHRSGKARSPIVVSGEIVGHGPPFMRPRSAFGLSENGRMLALATLSPAGEAMDVGGGSWSLIFHAIGGGPNLVTSGTLDITDVQEGFVGGSERRARTALGWNSKTRHVYLVTVDGGRKDWSIGMTLTELGALLVDLGCDSGLSYGYGSDTVSWAAGKVLNRPIGNEEPEIVAAWGVVPLK